MPRTYRQRRGQESAEIVARFLQLIAPGCRARPGSYAGNDLEFIDWDVEVKARRDEDFSPFGWVRQACKRRKPEQVLPPMVVLRGDGMGPDDPGEFLVLRRFDDDREILGELLWSRKMIAMLFNQRRLEMLEYTESHGGWMSAAARAELEELRAAKEQSG